MRRSLCHLLLAGTAAMGASAGPDEDWRKLGNVEPAVLAEPIFGPMESRGGEIAGFPASNVTLLSWLPVGWFPGEQRSASDCWGYVSPSGREYALLGLHAAFAVLDVTDPTYPRLLAMIEGNGSLWRDIKVIGHHAYGVSEGGLGIQVIDLSQADQGIVTHVRNKMQNGHSSTHNIASNPDSGYLYLCGANIANGGLVAVNTTDPEDPIIEGAWSGRYVHDAQIITYTEGPYAGREIAFCGTGSGGVQVVDVTDKGNMFRIGQHRYAGTHYCHQVWASEDRQFLFVNDEMDEGTSFEVTTTHVIDISDPSQPREVTTFTTGLSSTDHNLYIKGDLAFQANYRSGLRVFDISNPFEAQEIAYLDTVADSDEAGYHGAWSTYPYYPSGTVLISDIERGLFILRLGENGLGFGFPDGLPEMLRPGLPTQVRAEVIANGVQLDPASVQLYVRNDGQTESFPMTEDGAGIFSGELPSGECFDLYDFWFSARDTDGLTYIEPFNAPVDGGIIAEVATSADEILTDDFNTDRGWVVQNGQAQSGGWARVIPEAGNPYEPDSDADGSGFAFVTGADPGEYLLGGPVYLVSPTLDLSRSPRARVEYSAWYDKGLLPAAQMIVQISDDNGMTWTDAATHGRTDGWRSFSFEVSEFIDPTAQARVRFVMNNSVGLTEVEGGVDGVRIAAPLCNPCLADYNEDGTVNTLDFLSYLNDYTGATNQGDPDLNGDGEVNTLDFLLFLNLYTAGC